MEITNAYEVVSTIKHLGRSVKSGVVQLTKEQAKPWLDSGSIVEHSDESNSGDSPIDNIIDLADRLSEEDKKVLIASLTTMQPYQELILERIELLEELSEEAPQQANSSEVSLVDAIGQLDPDDEALWLKSTGAPSTEALEAIVDETVTAAERDQAWEEFQTLKKDE